MTDRRFYEPFLVNGWPHRSSRDLLDNLQQCQ
jgi:hypothetical protein